MTGKTHGLKHLKYMLPNDTMYQGEVAARSSKTIHVSADNGSDTTGDGSETNVFASVQHVLDTITGVFLEIIVDQSVEEVITIPDGTEMSISSKTGAYQTYGYIHANIGNGCFLTFNDIWLKIFFGTRTSGTYFTFENCILDEYTGSVRSDDDFTFLGSTDFEAIMGAAKIAGAGSRGNSLVHTSGVTVFDGELEIDDPTQDSHADTKGARNIAISAYQQTSEKGNAGGYASLDGTGWVPLSQLPDSIQGGIIYQGTWNASTNTPTLASGVGTKGHGYKVSVAGTTNLDGITDWQVGDWAVYDGTAWQKIDNTDIVMSVFGRIGVVVAQAGDYLASQVTNAFDLLVNKFTDGQTATKAELNAAVSDATLEDKTILEGTMDSKDTAAIGTHAGIAGAHHTRYADSEAVSAMGVKADTNPLNHDRPIFGTQLHNGESDGVSATSLTAYQEKLKLTTGTLPAGDYMIVWSCEITNSAKDKMSEVRVQVDDTTTIAEVRKPKVDANDVYLSMGGVKLITLTNATHDVDIDYRAVSDTASIRRARVELWRVS